MVASTHANGGATIGGERRIVRLVPHGAGHEVTVTARCGGFHGTAQDGLIGTIDAFCDAVERLHHTLAGEAVLQGMESVRLVFMGNGRGKIALHVSLEQAADEACLRFVLQVDQSYLPPFVAALRRGGR